MLWWRPKKCPDEESLSLNVSVYPWFNKGFIVIIYNHLGFLVRLPPGTMDQVHVAVWVFCHYSNFPSKWVTCILCNNQCTHYDYILSLLVHWSVAEACSPAVNPRDGQAPPQLSFDNFVFEKCVCDTITKELSALIQRCRNCSEMTQEAAASCVYRYISKANKTTAILSQSELMW